MNNSIRFPTALSAASFHIRPYEEGQSDKLIIFFGAKNLADSKFNFFQLGRELSEHLVFVNNGANDWYQSGIPGLGETFEDCVEVFRAWANVLGAKSIYCVGTSMGGWGAIQYGAALDASVLAFSCDALLGDEISRSYGYLQTDQTVILPDLREAIRGSKAKITLIAGERDATDLCAAALLSKVPSVDVVTLVGCGHYVPPYLSRDGRLGPILRSFVSNRPLPISGDIGKATENDAYIEAIYNSRKAQVRTDWQASAKYAETALEILPYAEAAELLLGYARIKLWDFKGAIGPLTSAAVSTPPSDLDALWMLATVWRRVGAYERSAQISKRMLILNPGNAEAHYNLALLAKASERPVKALMHVKAALRRDPNNGSYLRFLHKLEKH